MLVNGRSLLTLEPIKDMHEDKHKGHGVSYGLGEAGYDIRLAQDVRFHRGHGGDVNGAPFMGRFALASAMEFFHMPVTLVGVVHDKSTWARRGLSVFNTVIEPGWRGYLTLELVYHGYEGMVIPAGSGIAQVLFHEIANPAAYTGKYQNQENEPVPARNS